MVSPLLEGDAWVRSATPTRLETSPSQPGRWTTLVLPSVRNEGMAVILGELQPGESLPARAEPRPTTLCVLSGKACATWQAPDETSADLAPSRLWFVPAQVSHALRCTGTEPVRLLCFTIFAGASSESISPGPAAPFVRALDRSELVPVSGINGRWKRYVLPSLENLGMVTGLGELPPRTRMTWHAHPEPEVFTVISGTGRAYWRVGETEHVAEMKPGASFYKIGHIPHDMECAGDEPMLGIAFKIQHPR